LICNDDIYLLWQINSSREAFDELHPVLKAVGSTDLPRELNHPSTIYVVDSFGSSRACQESHYSRSGAEIENKVAGLHHFGDGLTKYGNTGGISKILAMLIND
jgi:hypothetical protein